MYECKYPVLESQLIELFVKVSRNQSAIITDSVLHETTSKVQPLDGGIIANFKAGFRKELIRFTLRHIEEGEIPKVEMRSAVIWTALAWANVTPITISNCWRTVGLLPEQGQMMCPETSQALNELEDLCVTLQESLARLFVRSRAAIWTEKG